MRTFLSRHRSILIVGAVGTVAVVAYLAFAVFGVHTLFVDDKVDEAAPVFASGAATPDEGDDVEPVGSAPATTVPATTVPADPVPADPVAEPTVTEAPGTTVPEVVTAAEGTFVDRSHPTSGSAVVLTDGTAERFLRFDDFATDNGPDLNVYLSTGAVDGPADAFDDDFVDLGTLKGNIGSQNYEIPPDVDLDRYSTVVVWCVRFAVAFGAAALT